MRSSAATDSNGSAVQRVSAQGGRRGRELRRRRSCLGAALAGSDPRAADRTGGPIVLLTRVVASAKVGSAMLQASAERAIVSKKIL